MLSARWPRRRAALSATALPSPTGVETHAPFLPHDQAHAIEELNRQLKSPGAFREVLPAGVEVISWYVLMGIGQIVTLRLAPVRLRDLRQLPETEAWQAVRTGACATYDFGALYSQLQGR